MSTDEDLPTTNDYAAILLQSLYKSQAYSDVTIRILPQDERESERW